MRQSVQLRYDWLILGLTTTCLFSEKFDVHYASFCKKGSLITKRHNAAREITEKFLPDVWKDVKFEPPLIQLQCVEQQPIAKTTSLTSRDTCKECQNQWVTKTFSVCFTHDAE